MGMTNPHAGNHAYPQAAVGTVRVVTQGTSRVRQVMQADGTWRNTIIGRA